MSDDTVCLDISTYNTLKSSEVKANLVIYELFRQVVVDSETGTLSCDSKKIDRVIELAYPKRYQNKISEVQENDIQSNRSDTAHTDNL